MRRAATGGGRSLEAIWSVRAEAEGRGVSGDVAEDQARANLEVSFGGGAVLDGMIRSLEAGVLPGACSLREEAGARSVDDGAVGVWSSTAGAMGGVVSVM